MTQDRDEVCAIIDRLEKNLVLANEAIERLEWPRAVGILQVCAEMTAASLRKLRDTLKP